MRTKIDLYRLGLWLCFSLELARFIWLLLLIVGILSACKRKQPPVQQTTITVNSAVDSARQQLQIKLDGANNTVIVSQQASQSAVTDYEQAKKKYDQTRVALPEHPHRATP